VLIVKQIAQLAIGVETRAKLTAYALRHGLV
jgi:hypothetical protein